ncbi:o-succinylbenzoate--CoA ligase [Sulfobacillus sp. DSM 109850]|uniref:2-succinylbenzoate--CoA ligase n=1 Tax=Sulfobacillus harzensis TaxID=2729629 RepID=A0A7Y0Q4M5_9FIRM|nr:o-succinylbenzoate--CoA ligase [Sulfobacillus harzensis]
MVQSPDWLHYQAEIHPQREALIFGQQRWTFAELDADVARLAGILADWGIGLQHRVAYRLRRSPEQVMLAHALTRLGAVLVPLNTRLKPGELEPIIQNADPTLIVEDGSDFAWPDTGHRRIILEELMEGSLAQPLFTATLNFEDLHALVYTSGTTGTPKGVEITVGNQWWSAMGFGLNAGLEPHDRWLHIMPLFHVGGLTILFRSVIHGSTVVLEEGFDQVRTYDTLIRERISLLSVVPTMVHRLLELDGDAPPHLRLALLGGAPAAPALIERAHQRGYRVVPTYGMTETCSQIVTLEESEWPKRAGSSGHPNLPVDVRIMKDNRPLPAGKVGEIWVRGPMVARGYWNNPQATRTTFHDGWLRTGDIGYLDPDGFLYVIDRLRDMIIRGGENIYPSEVEQHLVGHPGVSDVAVFGVQDEEWGQRVAVAVVVSDPALTPKDLRNFLSNRLASYKIPSIYYRVDAIPRNASGKILRATLRDQTSAMTKWTENHDL